MNEPLAGVWAGLRELRPVRDRLIGIQAQFDQLRAEQAELTAWIGVRLDEIDRLLAAADPSNTDRSDERSE